MKKMNWLWIFWGIVLIMLASLGISYALQKRRNRSNSSDLIIGGLANSNALLIYNLSQKENKTQKQEFSDEFSDEFF